jgi:hypothetical protein
MSYLLSADTKTRFFVEIKNIDQKEALEESISDALAKNAGEALVELITYRYFPVGTQLSIARMQENLLGTVVGAERYIQDLNILSVKVFYIID